MAAAAVIRLLEALADEAWPPAVTEEHDGWLLRWDEGPWNRTNSVAPLDPGSAPLPAKIDHAERWYLDRGRDPNFKLTEASQPPGLEAALARRGYETTFAVSVRVRPAGAGGPPEDGTLTERPTGRWLEAKRRIAGVAGERTRHLPALLGRISAPAAFAAVPGTGIPVAVGLAVVTGGHVGIFDLAVDPSFRHRGLAAGIVSILTAWGAGLGAHTAYLQVEEDNEPALALYRRLGFAEVYRYWYRRLPGAGG